MEQAERTWQRISSGPFARLVRHAVERIFAGSETAEPGELDLGIGTILALLATPGVFVAIFLFDRYGSLLHFLRGEKIHFDPYRESIPDEYFFIVLAMVVAAFVAVWKWDRLVPDRRDYANLAPLPIGRDRIFAANLCALALLAGVFAVDVNVAPALVFPLVVCAQESAGVAVNFFATHMAAVFLASAFGFLAVFAAMGVLMAVLPYRVFRAASAYVRCGMIFVLMALLTTSFSVPPKLARVGDVSRAWSALPPPAWFLGLCQTLRGEKDAVFLSLSGAALAALAGAALLSLATYSLCFARFFRQGAETFASLPAGRPALSSWGFRLLDGIMLRSPFQRACYRFALRTISRGSEQAFVLGGFLSLGAILAAQTLLSEPHKRAGYAVVSRPSADVLSAPLILGYFATFGLWFVLGVPAPLRANWVFRFHVDSRCRECPALARRIILTFLGVALGAICLPLYWHFWGWRVGAIHTAVVGLWCVLLAEGLLARFRKIPFTCAMPKFKSHAIVVVLMLVLAYFGFTSVTATLESWALADPYWFIAFAPVVAGAVFAIYRRQKTQIETERDILFEEPNATVVEALNLQG